MDIAGHYEGDEWAERPNVLHTQHLRAYGGGGFSLVDQEEPGGCPRYYQARYVLRAPETAQLSPALVYGSTLHRALQTMDERETGPEDALRAVWDPLLGPEQYERALDELGRYVERGGSLAGTLATEQYLEAELYVDESAGPISFGGRIDKLALETDPLTVHVTDYKSGWSTVPSLDVVRGDVQLRGYAWLVSRCWAQLGLDEPPEIVVHLDAISRRDVSYTYSDAELEAWAAWAEAVARSILADETAEPRLNPSCNWCEIKFNCPAYGSLPGLGVTLNERRVNGVNEPLPHLVRWRDEAKQTVKTLTAGVKEVDQMIAARVDVSGEVMVGTRRWAYDDDMAWECDIDKLFAALGRQVLEIGPPSKTAVERWLTRQGRTGDPTVMAAFSRVPVGRKIVERKVAEDDA